MRELSCEEPQEEEQGEEQGEEQEQEGKVTEVTVEEAAVPVPGMAGMAGYEQAAAYPGPQVRTSLSILAEPLSLSKCRFFVRGQDFMI